MDVIQGTYVLKFWASIRYLLVNSAKFIRRCLGILIKGRHAKTFYKTS